MLCRGRGYPGGLGRELPNPPPGHFEISFDQLIRGVKLEVPIKLGEAYLAGAGAIGNGLLWAARHIRLRGRLNVVDDDNVSAGNLQRQIWFDQDDIDEPKALRLALKAQPFCP